MDRRIAESTQTLSDAVTASGSTLTELLGIGDVTAKILACTGSITGFPSAATFASYCGVAPIEVSPGDVVRHRLSRASDRQLNYALHVMALAQTDTTVPVAATTSARASRGRATQRPCAA